MSWRRRLALLLACGWVALARAADPAAAAGADPWDRLDAAGYVVTRYEVGCYAGHSYLPASNIDWLDLEVAAILDYDRVLPHPAPPPLRLKLELRLGGVDDPQQRMTAAANLLALYYLEAWGGPRWRPYVEAGIGGIYTDFQLEHQGLRVNFNPLAGAGLEWRTAGGARLFVALRLHHVSNGGLNRENDGINSAFVGAGWRF